MANPSADPVQPSPDTSFLSSPRAKVKHDAQFLSSSTPFIPIPTVELLSEYSGIPASEQTLHIVSLRNEAYKAHHYPCLGLYRFLNLSLSTHPLYKGHVLPVLSSSHTEGESRPLFLDLGTCLGQDVRKLIYDGAPVSQVYGCDILPEFIDIGYRLFRDESKFPRDHFLCPADVFDDSPGNVLSELDGKLTILSMNAVFHLFNYADQMTIAKRVVKLMKPMSGSLIMGSQNANLKPGEYPSRPGHRSETLFRHNEESWARLWEKVSGELGRTVSFRVSSQLEPHSVPEGVEEPDQGQWRDKGFTWMKWSVWVDF